MLILSVLDRGTPRDILGADVGSSIDQKLHHRFLTVQRRRHQRRISPRGFGVRVGTMVQQRSEGAGISQSHRDHQWSNTGRISVVSRGACFKQRFDMGQIPILRGLEDPIVGTALGAMLALAISRILASSLVMINTFGATAKRGGALYSAWLT
jgi:hypothetical protein